MLLISEEIGLNLTEMSAQVQSMMSRLKTGYKQRPTGLNFL